MKNIMLPIHKKNSKLNLKEMQYVIHSEYILIMQVQKNKKIK